jgi:hypothetical protein
MLLNVGVATLHIPALPALTFVTYKSLLKLGVLGGKKKWWWYLSDCLV